jgi:hypothetical protein
MRHDPRSEWVAAHIGQVFLEEVSRPHGVAGVAASVRMAHRDA